MALRLCCFASRIALLREAEAEDAEAAEVGAGVVKSTPEDGALRGVDGPPAPAEEVEREGGAGGGGCIACVK